MNTTSGVRPASVRRRSIAKTDHAGAARRPTRAGRRARRKCLPHTTGVEGPAFIVRLGRIAAAARFAGPREGPRQRPVKDSLVRLVRATGAADRDPGAAHRDARDWMQPRARWRGEPGVAGTRSDRAGHRLKIRSIRAVTRDVARAIAIRSPLRSTTLKISAAAGAIESSADESPLRRRRSWASPTTTRGR
jgi:hypothetical protein